MISVFLRYSTQRGMMWINIKKKDDDRVIPERIKEIRLDAKLSQKAFGEIFGMSRDEIGNIEYDRVKPKPLFIKHLCQEFTVNEEWLLHGEGEKYQQHPKNEELLRLVEEIADSNNELIKEIILKINKLEEPHQKIIKSIVDALLEKKT